MGISRTSIWLSTTISRNHATVLLDFHDTAGWLMTWKPNLYIASVEWKKDMEYFERKQNAHKTTHVRADKRMTKVHPNSKVK